MIQPLKAGDDIRRNWRTINEIAAGLEDLRVPNQSRDSGIAGQRQRPRDVFALPFAIYQASTWLKYKVRAGIIITTGNPITPANLETEITITGGVARYWFYLDITPTTASVESSATTLTWAVDKFPLGWVDTTVSGIGTITQFQHDNILSPCVT